MMMDSAVVDRLEPDTDLATTDRNAGPLARQVALVRRACAYIDAQEGGPITLARLAAQVKTSPWHLQRLFKKVIGLSPRDYADAQRLARFRNELKQGETIARATYGAGYGSSSRVYEAAQQHLGMTPASYAKGGKGADITYAVVDSPLGRLLVAATTKGLCFVSLSDDDSELIAALHKEFPNADALTRNDEAIAPSVNILLTYLAGETPHIDLPLDVRATAFQRRVWQELIAVPCGETRSYSEIATALGLPRGQRAVARACASNPLPIIVPCHRIIREDGGLGGYRWGIARKERLLEQELKLKN